MEKWSDIIAIAISSLSFLFSLAAFVVTVIHDRTQATLDAFNHLQGEAFDHLNKISPWEIRDIVAHPGTRSDEYNTISGYIARIEHFCVGVNTGIYDKRIVYKLAHGYMDEAKLRSRIEPVIDRKNRAGTTDNYQNIHKVLKWMDAVSHRREILSRLVRHR